MLIKKNIKKRNSFMDVGGDNGPQWHESYEYRRKQIQSIDFGYKLNNKWHGWGGQWQYPLWRIFDPLFKSYQFKSLSQGEDITLIDGIKYLLNGNELVRRYHKRSNYYYSFPKPKKQDDEKLMATMMNTNIGLPSLQDFMNGV